MSSGPGATGDRAILDGIERVVREHLGREVSLSPDQRLVEVLELDSIRRLTLVIEVENHFRICFEEADETGIETVRDLIDAIRRRA